MTLTNDQVRFILNFVHVEMFDFPLPVQIYISEEEAEKFIVDFLKQIREAYSVVCESYKQLYKEVDNV